MNEKNYRPHSEDPASQHFVDASLEELARLGNRDDEAFLEKMEQTLDQVDSEILASKNGTIPPATRNPFWGISGAVAAVVAGGIFLSIYSSKWNKPRPGDSTTIASLPEHPEKTVPVEKKETEVLEVKKPVVRQIPKTTDVELAQKRGTPSNWAPPTDEPCPVEAISDLASNISVGYDSEYIFRGTRMTPEIEASNIASIDTSYFGKKPDRETVRGRRILNGTASIVGDKTSGWDDYYQGAELSIALNCRATVTPYIGYNGTPDTWGIDIGRNTKTTDHVIRRELPLLPGEPLDAVGYGRSNRGRSDLRLTSGAVTSNRQGKLDKHTYGGGEYQYKATDIDNASQNPLDVLATVNGKTITRGEVDEAVRSRVQLYLIENEGIDTAAQAEKSIKEMQKTALNDLIDRKLFAEEFDRMGGEIKPEYIDQAVERFVKQRFGGDRERFLKTLEKMKFPLATFREIQREGIVANALEARFSDRKVDKNDEHKRFVQALRKQANIKIFKEIPKPAAEQERYGQLVDNPYASPLIAPLSTFSVDVDTASYSNVRRMINQGYAIPRDAVRIEELINYFSYDYPQPENEHPFAFAIETARCPWNANHQLMRVGIQGREMQRDKRPAANLVFLLDVSGSMSPANKLPLVKQSMKLVIEELTARDTISMVVYAGAEGLCLPPTHGNEKEKILAALDNLKSGGSTNGGAGIQLAYKMAKENYKEKRNQSRHSLYRW